jgi:hypothetical protein
MSIQVNPFYTAMLHFKRGNWDECIRECSKILEKNPRDEAVWFLKARALVKREYIDDIEMDEEGLGDMIMDENNMATAPRPGEDSILFDVTVYFVIMDENNMATAPKPGKRRTM